MRPLFCYCLIALLTVNAEINATTAKGNNSFSAEINLENAKGDNSFDAEVNATETIGNNSVKGTPLISCAQDAIYIQLKTTNKFVGKVYLKGHSPEGAKCFQVLITANQVEVLIPHLDCNVQRTRSLNPAGLFIVAVMIISFHEHFVTEGDRIFEIKCFHMQSLAVGKRPSNVSNESLIPSSKPSAQLFPVCRYSVLREADNSSALVRFATIGQLVYHHWTCEATNSTQLCLLVTNCFVANQLTGKRHELIGSDGCSKDTAVMRNLLYDDQVLAARQEVKVFGVADTPQLYFQCQLTLIERSENEASCPRPDCDGESRSRRDIQTLLRESDAHVLDAASQRLNVLELDDRLSDLPNHVCRDYKNPLTRIERAIPPGSVCVSKASFGIVVTSTILVAICTLAVVVGSVCRRTSLVSEQIHDR